MSLKLITKNCIDCGKQFATKSDAKKRCDDCYDERVRKMAKIRYERYKEQGICVHCKHRPAEPGMTKCRECSDRKNAAEAATRRERKEYFEGYNRDVKAQSLAEVFRQYGLKKDDRLGVIVYGRKSKAWMI